MSTAELTLAETTIRAWKDEDFRFALAAQGRQVTDSPAGAVELADDVLGDVVGGQSLTSILTTVPCAGAVSSTFSCLTCEHTVWHGSCGTLSIGCCAAEQ